MRAALRRMVRQLMRLDADVAAADHGDFARQNGRVGAARSALWMNSACLNGDGSMHDLHIVDWQMRLRLGPIVSACDSTRSMSSAKRS